MNKYRNILMKIIIVWIGVTLVASGVIHYSRYKRDQEIANRWYSKYSIVAHAMGDIDGHYYTNTLEAFNKHYNAGTRVFEVDFSLTSDNKLVCTHGWKDHKINRLAYEEADDTPMSYDEFMNSLICGQYTPLDVDAVINIMKEHEDIYIILDFGADLDYDYETDTDKIFDIDALMLRNKMLIDRFKEVDESLLSRVIPQIYYEEHFEELDEYYHFDNYIYTLYKNYQNTTPKNIMQFTTDNDIFVITSNLVEDQEIITKEVLRQIKIDRTLTKEMALFLHTYDDVKDVDLLFEEGYSGVYSNKLDETYIKQVEE